MQKVWILIIFTALGLQASAQQQIDSAWLANNYVKWERMIPMRDGKKLFTAIYLPKDSGTRHPMLLTRTPYSSAPYGEKQFRPLWSTNHGFYCREKYIIVYQDVRGRHMSEGEFVDVRPFNAGKTGTETDEASDTYDTIDWLLQNLPGHNGRVGVFGISYPGFYSTMAALSGHPALKAVSPQAPVTDWFIGDDFHHHGAFMLMDAFEFYSGFGVPRPQPLTSYPGGYRRSEPDAYKFYLETGALPNFNRKYLGDSIAFWNDLMSQPVYNAWWKSRNTRQAVRNLKPAMLVVGGNFDAEDCFGAWNLYKAIEANHPFNHFNKVVMGPWFHGGWGGRSNGDSLGPVRFGSSTSLWYQENVEFPFFQHFLNDKPAPEQLAEATVFFTGENQWRQFDRWPPANMKTDALFLQAGGQLNGERPANSPNGQPDSSLLFTQYISDPANPVPHEGGFISSRSREYMVADQRFASARADVASFSSPPLRKAVTLAGPLVADLMVSLSTTDADFVVKLIDVFPDTIAQASQGPDTLYRQRTGMNGYQMMVRGEIMRGKFRNSHEIPEPFEPNKLTRVRFELPDVAHTFQPGHRIMVQVQSSWFPLVDRNPQQFLDIYKARDEDFIKSKVRIFHSAEAPSMILLPVLGE